MSWSGILTKQCVVIIYNNHKQCVVILRSEPQGQHFHILTNGMRDIRS